MDRSDPWCGRREEEGWLRDGMGKEAGVVMLSRHEAALELIALPRMITCWSLVS